MCEREREAETEILGSCFLHTLADVLTNNFTTNTEYVSLLLQVLPNEHLKEIKISILLQLLFSHLCLFVEVLTYLIVDCCCDGCAHALSLAALTFPTLYGVRYPMAMP